MCLWSLETKRISRWQLCMNRNVSSEVLRDSPPGEDDTRRPLEDKWSRQSAEPSKSAERISWICYILAIKLKNLLKVSELNSEARQLLYISMRSFITRTQEEIFLIFRKSLFMFLYELMLEIYCRVTII